MRLLEAIAATRLTTAAATRLYRRRIRLTVLGGHRVGAVLDRLAVAISATTILAIVAVVMPIIVAVAVPEAVLIAAPEVAITIGIVSR
jgi:hypothetical protein